MPEEKTVITTTSVGSETPGVIPAERDRGITTEPRNDSAINKLPKKPAKKPKK